MTSKKGSEKRRRTIPPLAGRFTPEEAALVRTKAKEYGGSVSNSIRQRTIDAQPPRHAADRALLARLLTEFQRHRAELGKQGSNLHQITHYANMATCADATNGLRSTFTSGDGRPRRGSSDNAT